MPEIGELSADFIAAQAGGFEAQRQNNFVLTVVPPGEGEQVLRLSMVSIPLPKEASNVIELPFGNEVRKVAGRTTFANINATFHDYVDQETLQILVNWRKNVYDPDTGNVGLASSYKRMATITMMGPETSFKRNYLVQGVWPSELDPGDLSYENAEKKLITVVFTFDKIKEVGAVASS